MRKSGASTAGLILAIITFILTGGMLILFLLERRASGGGAASITTAAMTCFYLALCTGVVSIILSAIGNKRAKSGFSGAALALSIVFTSLMLLVPLAVFIISMFG